MGLLWWDGITWDTPLRDIGWTYIVLLVLGAMLVRALRELRKLWK